MNIRRYLQGDEVVLWPLLYNTVHNVNIKDYSKNQVEAWAPKRWDMEQWQQRLIKTNPFVAEIKGKIVGFIECENNGHIDCFYCDYKWQQKGVGSALLDSVEKEASAKGISCLFAEVSITAKVFLRKRSLSLIMKVRYCYVENISPIMPYQRNY